MFDIENWAEIFSSIKKNKLRTFLTGFSISWGIFMFCILLSAGNGLRNGMTSNFGSRSVNSVQYWGRQTAIPFEGLSDKRQVKLDYKDMELLENKVPEVIDYSPMISTNRDVKYIIGVKTVLHKILPEDLADDLRELIMGNEKSLQKVRYTTGEISAQDYFFNIKGLKADAAKHINYNKRWLNTLKRLGEYSKLHGSLLKRGVEAITGGHVPLPNGTLILSQPDVTNILDRTGIDISVVSNANRLGKTLFLMAVIIVDSTREEMKVLYVNEDSQWDIQSLASLEVEVNKTDNTGLMKEFNRLVNR